MGFTRFLFFGVLCAAALTSSTGLAQSNPPSDLRPSVVRSLRGTHPHNSNQLMSAQASVAPQAVGLSLDTPVGYSSGGYDPAFAAVGDLNGDGKPDLVITNSCASADSNGSCTGSGKVAVLVGNGDGTFQTAITYDSGGYLAGHVVIADMTGDGVPDLLVVNSCDLLDANGQCTTGDVVSILRGMGDGSFQNGTIVRSGGYGANLAVADVNGDSKPDLFITNRCVDDACNALDTHVSVLLGNGDGTFQAAANYDSGGLGASSVAIADLNADGKADLVVTNLCYRDSPYSPYCAYGAVAVLKGNGNGTFQAPASYASGTDLGFDNDPHAVVVADMNTDGRADLVVLNWGSPDILLANADGSFQTPTCCGTPGLYTPGMSVADVDGDGQLDIEFSLSFGIPAYADVHDVLVVFLKGQPPFNEYDSGGVGVGTVIATDLNRDGKPDLVVTNACADTACAMGAADVILNTTPWPYKALVQPPINGDDTSVFKANRGVIPVRFTLTQNNVSTCTLPAATISVTRTAGRSLGFIDESAYLTNADDGSNFRIAGCQYAYNLAASSLGVGTYRIDISINGIMVGHAVFALK
jgi:hypothetical protein